jgi:selenocysteine lyase/cysteine desulfurase
MERRNFIRSLAGIAGSLSLAPLWGSAASLELQSNLHRVLGMSPGIGARDEEFWAQIRAAYTVKGNAHINLNNGAVSPMPRAVEQALFAHTTACNAGPSYFMRLLERNQYEDARTQLAGLLHCSPEEVAVLRNTTEALENVIFGLNLEKGDEVVLADLDYPSMVAAFEQRALREGIVVTRVELPIGAPTTEQYVSLYKGAITTKTKVLLITHVIHHTGQVLPIKAITEMAHSKGVEVIVDGAHSLGQMNVDVKDLGCDYYGSSLHKWLCAPFGTGVLYVKSDKIPALWPLFGSTGTVTDIRKFEHIGTRNVPSIAAIGTAIEFHNSIGTERKQARLIFLKNYWIAQMQDVPGINFTVSPELTSGICHFSVDGKDMTEMYRKLFNEHNIYTMLYKYENRLSGVRVSPHLFTSLDELDQFCTYSKEILSKM